METVLLSLGGVAVALLALGALIGKIWNGGKKVYKAVDTIERLEKLLDHEMTPNSGGSIKDQITRIELKIDEHISHHQTLN